MNPGHVRQPQIIRLLVGAALAALLPARAIAQVPCVSCLVIGVDAAAPESVQAMPPGALDGVELLVAAMADLGTFAATGASLAVLVVPSPAPTSAETLFDARTTITAVRADH